MKTTLTQPTDRRRHHAGGFSLIEIMVTVALLTVIVLGLLAMFNQTQRAFKSSMTQVDVLENARAATDMLFRDLEQMTAAGLPTNGGFSLNLYNGRPLPMNFYSELSAPAWISGGQTVVNLQALPGTTTKRTNVFSQFFFLTREAQDWRAIGYVVGTPYAGVGTLYRYETDCTVTSTNFPLDLAKAAASFDAAAKNLLSAGVISDQLHRIVDGVVSFRVRAYSPNGILLGPTNNLDNAYLRMNLAPRSIQDTEPEYYFYSNTLPAAVELEIGYLEDRALQRLNSIPDVNAQKQYLSDHAGQVHLFRQRISIRNCDPSIYRDVYR